MEPELELCEHTRLKGNCPLCEFEAKGPLSTQAFLEELPYEFPEEFPEFWGDGDSIRTQRRHLNEIEESCLKVSLEGFEGYKDDTCSLQKNSNHGHNPYTNLPYGRNETVGGNNAA